VPGARTGEGLRRWTKEIGIKRTPLKRGEREFGERAKKPDIRQGCEGTLKRFARVSEKLEKRAGVSNQTGVGRSLAGFEHQLQEGGKRLC